MTSKIQPLPTDVVHFIAAGEVIDSLAAVVRELAENALDAGATRLTISLWPDQWRVRVVDNGKGMDLEDLHGAAAPHSTSKIQNSEDLSHIATLGFRGEALHSLAQLGELEICSRPLQGEGWRVRYTIEGTLQSMEPVAIAPGTVVTVSDLFGVWTARRQNLSPGRMLKVVQMLVHHLACCHPHITWQMEQSDRPWFSIWPGQTARTIIPQLIREVAMDDLRELVREFPSEVTDTEDIEGFDAKTGASSQLYVLVGLPDRYHRRRPDWVRLAVNGRMVTLPDLEQAMMGVFRRILPRDRYPLCFVHLSVDPSQVDWNRHPAKTEIYLRDVDLWKTYILEAIAHVLRLNLAGDGLASGRVGQLLKVAEASGRYRSIEPQDEEAERSNPPMPESLRAIAQVHNTYIVAEHPSGVWLVEQHIAHERVLYEQLSDRWRCVALETPLRLKQLSSQQVEQLQDLGVDVAPFGEDLWAIRTVPEPLANREDCADALLELSQGDMEAALVATACRTAIRNGTPLTVTDMQTLLNQWQQTRHPQTCPHGRPIYLVLEESRLSRFFRRHWVIGKSHGI
jgi:DNA mismatch repair protein MutL